MEDIHGLRVIFLLELHIFYEKHYLCLQTHDQFTKNLQELI